MDNNSKNVAEIYFKFNRKDYFLNSENLNLRVGLYVIVEADKGADIGKVAVLSMNLNELKIETDDLKKIVRIADDKDLERLKRVREMEAKAKTQFLESLKKQPFIMHFVDVEYQFDGNRLTFYFMAKTRIDFRNFLKDLASIFHTRIELRQINDFQEIRRLGAFGVCGRELCCKKFISKLPTITSQMMRDQNIISTFSKISGICGKWLCCFAFEEENYQEISKSFPDIDDEITIRKKNMRVRKCNYLSSTIQLIDEDGNKKTISLSEFDAIKNKKSKRI
ncbi:MAG: Tpl protein [Candidatus Cloacimonetes bacterium]|nr:Tpl protein [Candidatus Cloacimonadota bacterium]MBL7107817.1 Tpl protein [Candidatus Cloacimonadota bacterium]